MTDALTASLEDYLEAISRIIAEKEAVRPKDIIRRLKVTGASVTGALRSLAERDLINYTPYDVITLTPEGKAAAADVIRRHEVLRDFFVRVLAVEEREADRAACRMEHSIPKLILERFIRFAEFAEQCPRGGSEWLSGSMEDCDRGLTKEKCGACLSRLTEQFRHQTGGKDDTAMTHLGGMKPGQKGRVVRIGSRSPACRRMVEMGVTPGTIVEVERVAPLGDPIDVKIKGYHLSLRKEEAKDVRVELL